jgi:DNA-binding response OmpR family regulator
VKKRVTGRIFPRHSMARILIVEDDPGMRGFLEESLTAAGHEVHTTVNGKEGVALFLFQPADLIITDLLMPEQDGLETVQQLRIHDPALKVVAISGAPTDWKVLEMAGKLGANKTLHKPFTTREMRDAVEACLQE